MSADTYLVYVRIYGRLASTGRLTDQDYGKTTDDGFEDHPAEIQVAISLASQDVSLGDRMKTKMDFIDELGRLLG